MAVLTGFTRGKEKRDGGHYWNPTGHTLFITQAEDGTTRYTLSDSRTDKTISFFEKRQRSQGNTNADRSTSPQSPQDGPPF